jgi:pyrroloquinoline quinone (PQQ) biosynthesis protein C
MEPIRREHGLRRIYQIDTAGDATSLRLRDRVIELGARERTQYDAVARWIPSNRSRAELAAELGVDDAGLARLFAALERAGLIYSLAAAPAALSGETFHREVFAKALPSWLAEAFSHPFWERMTGGGGSARLFAGWMIELYHYTRNANRHMPLSCAHAREKPVKLLRAKHYAEEWNHYHYFMKSLKALGFSDEAVRESVPLPMTLALSNFMRQAAREDVLAYSICSAVLENTTTDRSTYNPYYEKCALLYNIPRSAIQPIYAHLDLDVQYQHSDLFLEILKTIPELSAVRAARVLDYGHQLVEHIWLWTDNIEKYYERESNPMPRRPFDPQLD